MDDDDILGEFNIDDFLRSAEPADDGNAMMTERNGKRVLFAIDASNSMAGYKLGAVNDSVSNAIAKLRSLARGRGVSLVVAVIGFSERAFKWTSSYVPVDNFEYSYVEEADGLSDMNSLFRELIAIAGEGMERGMRQTVVLYTDGLPTEDCQESFDLWKRTDAYSNTLKVVMAFGADIEDPQSYGFFRMFADGGKIIDMQNQEELIEILAADS